MRIDRSVAIVTGGASGLGRASAEALSESGATVVAVDLADPAAGRPEHDRIVSVVADVTDRDAVADVVRGAVELAPLRIVVNCAGVVTPGRVVSRGQPLDLDAFRRVLEINVVGTFNVLSQAAAAMIRTGLIGEERGVVINTASVAAFDGQIGQAAYAASKAAVAGMTLPLARDLAEHGIRAIAVAPGMFGTALLDGLSPGVVESLGRQVPHPSRIGRPKEFAALVAHIVENPMINGEVIRIDGAMRMAPR